VEFPQVGFQREDLFSAMLWAFQVMSISIHVLYPESR
jgi:hypothetical protein